MRLRKSTDTLFEDIDTFRRQMKALGTPSEISAYAAHQPLRHIPPALQPELEHTAPPVPYMTAKLSDVVLVVETPPQPVYDWATETAVDQPVEDATHPAFHKATFESVDSVAFLHAAARFARTTEAS